MKLTIYSLALIPLLFALPSNADMHNSAELIRQQAALAKNTANKGFGPQSPRDLGSTAGANKRTFAAAPPHTEMNLCNIHFHKNAEHKGGEFTRVAGPGDGKGNNTGFVYAGKLSKSELNQANSPVCKGDGSLLMAGDTIELHYVHSTAKVKPGPTLGSCISESINNPQLRVEAQVFVLVNDEKALDFTKLTEHRIANGYHQATNIPSDTGKPIQYAGSTTGPAYNEKGSPFQVTWNVRPEVAKVNVASVGSWCQLNTFDETHAHGVRNLVKNPALLSEIE